MLLLVVIRVDLVLIVVVLEVRYLIVHLIPSSVTEHIIEQITNWKACTILYLQLL